MPVDLDKIKPGTFFRTERNQVRKVHEVNGDDVVYSARGGDFRGAFGPRVTVSKAKFAEDVLEPCDETWDPNYVKK